MRKSFHGLTTTRARACRRESGELDALLLIILSNVLGIGVGVILLIIWVAWYIMANFGKHNKKLSKRVLISDIVGGGNFRSSDRLTM